MASSLFPHRFTAGCILLGFAIMGVGIYLAIQVEQRKTWPQTEAEIVENGWSESGESIGVRIKVRYEVHEQNQERSFFIEDWANDHELQTQVGPFSSAPETIPSKYRIGSQIQIFYEPGNPENAVLDPGNHWMNAYAILFGLLLVAFGSLSPIYSFLMWRADRLLDKAKAQMQEFVTNIEELEKILDEFEDKDSPEYKACLAQHQHLVDEFEGLYGTYKILSKEVRGD